MSKISARVAEMAEGIYEMAISRVVEEQGSSVLPSTIFRSHAVTAMRAAEEFYRVFDEFDRRTDRIKRFDLVETLKPEAE